MNNLINCCGSGDCFSTSMNTIGMGGVDPYNSDFIPQNRKKRKITPLKDIIRKLLKKRIKEK